MNKMTPEMLADLRSAHPEWVKLGLKLKDPTFSRVEFTRETLHHKYPDQAQPNKRQPQRGAQFAALVPPITSPFYPYDGQPSGGNPGPPPLWDITGAQDPPPIVTLIVSPPTTIPMYLLSPPFSTDFVSYTDNGLSTGYTYYISCDQIDFGDWEIGALSIVFGYKSLFGTYLQHTPPGLGSVYVFDLFPTTITVNGTTTLTRTVATDVTTLTEGSSIWKGSGYSVFYGLEPISQLFKFQAIDPSGNFYVLIPNQKGPNVNGANNYFCAATGGSITVA
jgi:hypothetical protein